ncbi:MAG: PAS domain-containing protein [Chloroflexi bacterium]|nr:PAS domain-containing protein [Chloroflexota bacterium]
MRLFASDANASMIQRARRGLYPPSIEEDISPERLEAHFSQEAEGYRVRDHIGRMIVWSVHDLVENPPFSNLHLMSCRNVLIYFQRRLQKRVFALMQYAVERDGILFLGSAESLPDYVDTFTAVDSRHRIYRQTGDGRQSWTRLDQPLFTQLPDRSPRGHADRAPAEADLAPQDALIKQGLAAHFNTSGALVDQAMQVRYTYGQIYHYLRVLPGPNRQHSILDMVVDGLKDELATVLYQAFETDSPVTRHGLRFESNGREHHIDLSVRLAAHEDGARLGVVMFQQVPEPAPDRATQGDSAAEIARLEAELDDTRAALHTLTRALKAKDEDFIASMEEIRAASEEFRISQEEAETTREELESLNEELNTLNNQLIAQNDELTEANNTLHNFLQSTEIAMVFLNQALAVREYTRRAADIFSLRPADVGRPLGDIANRLVDDDLEQDAYTVLNNLGQVEKEIQTRDDRWYILRIRPSRTVQNAVDGLVLTFSDITAQKDTQAALQETESQQRALAEAVEAERSRLATVLANLPVGVWITDRDGRVLETNPQARQIWAGETPLSESVEAYREYRSWWLDTGREILPEEQPLAQVLKTGEPVLGVEMRIQRFDGTTGVILASAAPIIDPLQDFIGAVGIAQDITERQRTRDAMRENERQRERLTIVETEQRRLQAVLEDLPLAVWITDDDGRITHATRQSDVIWGSMAPHAETVEADRIYPLYWPDTGEEVTPEEHPLVRALATGERVPWTRLHVRRPDGDTRIVLFSATAVQDGDGLAGAVGVGQDITDIHHVLERVDYQRQLINLIENGLLVLDGDLRVLTANAAFYETFQVSEEETVGTLLTDLGNGQWDIPEPRRLLTEVLAEREIVRSYRVTHEFPGLGQRTMILNARQIAELDRVLLVITDISK